MGEATLLGVRAAGGATLKAMCGGKTKKEKRGDAEVYAPAFNWSKHAQPTASAVPGAVDTRTGNESRPVPLAGTAGARPCTQAKAPVEALVVANAHVARKPPEGSVMLGLAVLGVELLDHV